MKKKFKYFVTFYNEAGISLKIIKIKILDGLKFYRSENNVILSPGDQMGFIKPRYFKFVIDLKNGNITKNNND